MDQQTGRGNQKLRTRNAIIAAARDLVRQGQLPSVAQVAEAALVSPATAYRYFPDQLSLLRAAVPDELPRDSEIATPNYPATDDPAERIARAATDFLRLTLKREPIVRAVMALSLLQSIEAPAQRNEATTLRPGYRRAWIEQALAPLAGKIDADTLERLSNALANNPARQMLRAQSKCHILKYVEMGEEHIILEDVAEGTLLRGYGYMPLAVEIHYLVERDMTALGREQSREQAQYRCLARPTLPQQYRRPAHLRPKT